MPLIDVKTYYLSIQAPQHTLEVVFPEHFTIQHWEKPTVEQYLEIYQSIGNPWGWTGRLQIAKEALHEILRSPKNQIYLLKENGRPIGLVEYDTQQKERPEIVYFGLHENQIGKGLGKRFIQWSIQEAFSWDIDELWLHTCEYDHPKALSFYQKAGFEIYDERVEQEYYSEEFLKNYEL